MAVLSHIVFRRSTTQITYTKPVSQIVVTRIIPSRGGGNGNGLPAGGTVGQVVTNTGPGTGDWEDATGGQDLSTYYHAGGTDVAVADGGTGASTAAAARTNLSSERQFQVNVMDYGCVADGTTDDSAAIQSAITAAAHNATFTGRSGVVWFPLGKYYIATGLTAATNASSPGLTLCGEGVSGVDSNLAPAATEIIVGNGQWGLTLGTNTQTFRGFAVRDLGFSEKNAGQALGGLHLLATSNGVYERCSFGRFTAGTGILIDAPDSSNQAQYNTFIDCRVGKCLIGFEQRHANGTVWLGGYLDGANNGTGITSSSLGMKLTSGDTFRSIGTRVQGWDTLVEVGANLGHEFYGLRCEIWTTQAIHVLSGADGTKLYGHGDNSLTGGGGAGVVIDSGATDTTVGTAMVNCSVGRLVDSGTRTRVTADQGPASAGSVVGAVVGKRPVYSTQGALVGYEPIYDAITGISLNRYLGNVNPGTTSVSSLARTVLTAGVAIGETIIIGGGYGGGSTVTVTAADTGSNAYTVDLHNDLTTGDTPHSFVISAKVTTALAIGDTITVSFSAPVNYPVMHVYDYAGFLTSSWADTTAGATGTGTSVASGSLTSTVPNDLLFASVFSGDTTQTAGSGFTVLNTNNNTTKRLSTMSQASTAAGAYAAAATLGTSKGWAVSLVAYKPVPSSATPVVSDAVYGSGWDGVVDQAPSKNAVYDKIQTLGAGATNLTYTASPTDGTVVSDTGTDATLPLATGTNAGLLKPVDFTKLSNTSGTNTGDQDLSALAPKASPTFTGTVTVPSGAVLATPASVTLTNGTGLPESGVTNLTTDLAAKAPLASPTFTGTVTVPSGAVLGTPTSVNLSNATALPDTALSSHGTAGTYGDGTHIPVITTDARGFVTAVSTATPTVADPPTVAIIARANYK